MNNGNETDNPSNNEGEVVQPQEEDVKVEEAPGETNVDPAGAQEDEKVEENPERPQEGEEAQNEERKVENVAEDQKEEAPAVEERKGDNQEEDKKEEEKIPSKPPTAKKGGKKGKEKPKSKKEREKEAKLAEEEAQRKAAEEEAAKKAAEEEAARKAAEEEAARIAEEQRRLEEEAAKKAEEEEEDKRILTLVQFLIDCQFVYSKEDPRLTDDIIKVFFDFIDYPEKTHLYLKKDSNDNIILKENLNELYSPSDNEYNFCFFIKKDPDRQITRENVDNTVIFDYVVGNIDKYLLDKMNDSLSEKIYNLQWPEGIKNDLISNMHKFLIVLSQSYYHDQNKVVLYIPRENVSNPAEASKDKELVTRLETIMIEWTNQIRDFLSNQDNASNREDFDVNQEIDYLESRKENLAYISEQLENRDLQDIVHILEKARASSENLKGFVDLQSRILEQRKIASETHNYLKILKDPCDKIKNPESEISQISPLLNLIMDKIRVITQYCETYKTPEDVANLLKKVSFQLIHKFTQKIEENDKNIVTEYSDKLHKNIIDIKECVLEWKKIYKNSKDRILSSNEDGLKEKWNFEQKDYQSIFYELETFEKRCLNLEEICLCQLQFGKNKNQSNKPIWGGTKRIEISKQLKDIEDKFDDKMILLFHDGSNVLNTKVNKWQEEFRIFSKNIEDLEDMYKNTISSAFKRVNTLEEAVNYEKYNIKCI